MGLRRLLLALLLALTLLALTARAHRDRRHVRIAKTSTATATTTISSSPGPSRLAASSSSSGIVLADMTWKFASANGSVVGDASVPGQVHADLVAQGVLGDPLFRYNDIEQRWVADEVWTYSGGFQWAGGEKKRAKRVNRASRARRGDEEGAMWLVAEGIDTVANVTLNGAAVGTTDNMFRRYIWNVDGLVRDGENELRVVIDSAAKVARAMREAYPYTVPVSEYPSEIEARQFMRKSQASFGWDWGPAFAPAGIWKPIYLVQAPVLLLDIVPIVTTTAFDAAGVPTAFAVDVRVLMRTGSKIKPDALHVTATVAGLDGASGQAEWRPVAGEENEVLVSLTANAPTLWWCNGEGEPFLYTLDVLVGSPASGTVASSNVTIGFRDVQLVQENVGGSQPGKSFYFRLNGRNVFAKGSNWIPADVFQARVSNDDLDRMLGDVVDIGSNMIRNWGGGIYQVDHFYDVADKRGLMIWEEFMFACSLYPTNDAFLRSVELEVRDNVRRLASHPSIVLWAGSNENQLALLTNWYPETVDQPYMYTIDYSALYRDTVQRVVEQEDPSRAWIASSPSNGLVSTDPYMEVWSASNSSDYGDVHFYTYDTKCTDLSVYPTPRFASEFGFQSFPSFQSLRSVSLPEDWSPMSPLMEHRQHHPNGTQELMALIGKLFHLPTASNTTDYFEDFIFLTQAAQALCMRTETEHYRRGRTSPAGTMGVLYWQANGIWQAPDWSSVEYGGRWKILHYAMRDAFAPVIASIAETTPSVVQVTVNNDGVAATNVTVVTAAFKWADGTVATQAAFTGTVDGHSSRVVFDKNVSSILADAGGLSREDVFLYTIATADDKVLPNNWWFLSNLANVTLANPQLSLAVDDVSWNSASVDISAVAPAAYVWLESTVDGVWSENGFVLATNGTIGVEFTARNATAFKDLTAADVLATMRVRSLFDTVN